MARMPSHNKKVVRTYKAGLKLPASLLEPFTHLVRERETVVELYAHEHLLP